MTEEEQSKHMKFRCTICRFKTFSNYCLKHHLNSVHLKIKPFSCSEPGCNQKYGYEYQLRYHHQRKHQNIKKYICEWCSRGFYDHCTLKKHVVRKHSESPETWSCDQCKFTTRCQDLLNKHKQSRHLGIRPYVCDYCGFSTSHRQHLKRHINNLHLNNNNNGQGQQQHSCHLCSFKSQRRDNMKAHVIKRHNGEML